MTTDWINVLTRFALYLDLMLAFGLPLFALHALRGSERSSDLAWRINRAATVFVLLGVGLSVASLVIVCKAMMGVQTYAEVGLQDLVAMITDTGFGAAWMVRLVALAIFLASVVLFKGLIRTIAMSTTAAIALATLAWGGHGAMSDGLGKLLHLGADILHLLAVGAWVGSLAAFLFMLRWAASATLQHVDMLSRALNEFALVGTIIVLSLIVTGGINYGMIVGMTLTGLWSTSYGLLLMAKLALFGMMLGLAAINRYRLGPLLEKKKQAGNYNGAMTLLRKSLVTETACAMLILGAVAWLGVLEPMSR